MLVYGSVVHLLTMVYLYMSFDEYEVRPKQPKPFLSRRK